MSSTPPPPPPQQPQSPRPARGDEEVGPLPIPVATSDTLPGRRITAYVGPTFGVIARSMGFARGFTGSLKALKRGEVKEFTATLEQARQHAVSRMAQNAVAMGANAVVGMRFDSSDIGEQQGLAEIVAYGTAVVVD